MNIVKLVSDMGTFFLLFVAAIMHVGGRIQFMDNAKTTERIDFRENEQLYNSTSPC